jgi:nucleotide-binding universal stress UspA family protein
MAARAPAPTVSLVRNIPFFERIVVGVDGREGGRDALALAVLLQGVCGGEVVAVYTYPYDRTVSLDDAVGVEAVLHEDLLAELEAELTRARVVARPVVVADASPARVLQSIAKRDGADLIVVGAPHRSGADRVLGGDVAASTMHAAPCAVAVAPEGFAARERALRTVGAGFDDSDESRAALALARRIAQAAGATVESLTAPADRAAAWLADRSRDLDLLVVGSRSHGPVRRLLLGSTSTRLVRETACPLLIVPRGIEEPAADEDAAAAATG